MVNIKNECNNCGEPCLDNKCNMKVVEHYYCDNCGDEFDPDDIYIFNGKDLCRWCLLSQFKTISEIR